MATENNAGAKVIGVLSLVVATWGVYQLFFKKEKKSLGDLNTAKTKAGKVKQRAAVFAKLDEEGKTFPKNRNGKRKPKRKK